MKLSKKFFETSDFYHQQLDCKKYYLQDLDSCTEDLPKIVYTANDWIHNINTNTNV